MGAAGSACLIGFRNRSRKKSIVVMHLFGMTKQDLVLKALTDAVIFAFFHHAQATGWGIYEETEKRKKNQNLQ